MNDIRNTLGSLDITDSRKRKTTIHFSPANNTEKKSMNELVHGNINRTFYHIIDSDDDGEDGGGPQKEMSIITMYLFLVISLLFIHYSSHTVESNNNRMVTLLEENIVNRINCVVLSTRLETNEEITTLKLQLDQWKDLYNRQTTKLENAMKEIQALKSEHHNRSVPVGLSPRPIPIHQQFFNNSVLNDANLRPLYRCVDVKPVDARIASLVYWNEKGHLVVPIRGHYLLSDLIHLFTDMRATDYEPGLLDAMIYLEGNCNIFVPYTLDQLNAMEMGFLYDATRSECFTHEPESPANLFNMRNILQNLVSLDLLQYTFNHSRKCAYSPSSLNQTTSINLTARIANPELLPFQPCHMTIAFSIPIKQKTANIHGDKKSCTLCGLGGSSAVIEHPKRNEAPGKKLRTHIFKTCPLVLLTQQHHTTTEKYSLDANSLANEIISHLNELDAIYEKCNVRLSLATRYYKFFGHTLLAVPDKFTSTLIDSQGAPYQTSRIKPVVA